VWRRQELWTVGVVNDGDDVGGGRGPCRFSKEDALVLAADDGATLIADDANGGDMGVTIFSGVFEDTVARAGTGGTSGAGLTTRIPLKDRHTRSCGPPALPSLARRPVPPFSWSC